jgi:hypothetical protein
MDSKISFTSHINLYDQKHSLQPEIESGPILNQFYFSSTYDEDHTFTGVAPSIKEARELSSKDCFRHRLLAREPILGVNSALTQDIISKELRKFKIKFGSKTAQVIIYDFSTRTEVQILTPILDRFNVFSHFSGIAISKLLTKRLV